MLKPLAILFNGLTVYSPDPLTPLSPLAEKLRQSGYETCVTNHFNTGCRNVRSPVLIIGHSQGGATALSLARAYPNALVITFDAVRMDSCRSHCINFHTPGYPLVLGATNVPVQLEHITMVLSSELQQRTLFHARQRLDRATAPHLTEKGTHPRRARPVVGRVRSEREPLQRAEGDSDTPFWFDRWPNRELDDWIDLDLEQLCALLSTKPKDVCP